MGQGFGLKVPDLTNAKDIKGGHGVLGWLMQMLLGLGGISLIKGIS